MPEEHWFGNADKSAFLAFLQKLFPLIKTTIGCCFVELAATCLFVASGYYQVISHDGYMYGGRKGNWFNRQIKRK